MPLRVQISVGKYIIFGGVFHARKDLRLGPKLVPNGEICFVPSLFRRRTLFSKIVPFWMRFWHAKHVSFWVDFGIKNRPKKVSFWSNFRLRGKHTPKQEDMLGCLVLVPKSFDYRSVEQLRTEI
jgi:hypothetical protein